MVRLPINRGTPEVRLWMEVIKALLHDIQPTVSRTSIDYYCEHKLSSELDGNPIRFACDALDINHSRFFNICMDIRAGKRKINLFSNT